MLPPIAIGRSDFKKLRQEGCLYVDKSHLIMDVVNKPVDVQLYPRPRRFGKTLGMTMLQYFFDRGEYQRALFSDLAVWQDENARPRSPTRRERDIPRRPVPPHPECRRAPVRNPTAPPGYKWDCCIH